MTFLNPLVLLGLAAAAIPVVLHLINLRRPQRVDFSSLTFVSTLKQESVRRLRIRRWLLLALRVGVVVCIVLAFAGPSVPGTWIGAGGERSAMSIGLVLDTSPSMRLNDEEGSRMGVARDRLRHVMGELQRQDELFTSTTTDPRPVRQVTGASAGERLATVEAGTSGQSVTQAATRMAEQLQRQARHDHRAVVVITDMQRSTFADSVALEWPAGVEALVLPAGSGTARNRAVTAVEVKSPFATVRQPVEIEAVVQQFGGSEQQETAPVSLYLDGERVAESGAQLRGGVASTVTFSVSPPRQGWLEGRVEISDDAPMPDDERHFVLHVPAEQEVLLVQGEGQNTSYLETVLGLDLGGGQPAFNVQVVSEDDFTGTDLSQFDSVLLTGLRSLDEGARGNIIRYVAGGGGLHLFPGAAMEQTDYEALLQALSAGSIEGRDGALGRDEPVSEASDFAMAHPVLSGIFETEDDSRIERPEVYHYVEYGTGETSSQPIIRLASGAPLVHELRHEEGRVVLWAVAPDLEWSDLPRRGLFVPLVHRSVHFTSSGASATGPDVESGENAIVALPAGSRSQTLRLTRENSDSYDVLAEVRAGRLAAHLRPAPDVPGVYDMMAGDSLIQRISVNLAARQSDSRVWSPEEAQRLFANITGVSPRIVEAGEERGAFQAALQEAGARVNLWSVFLIAALLFVVAETVVAHRRTGGKRR